MNCRTPSRDASTGFVSISRALGGALAAAMFVALLGASGAAMAQVLYKWNDAQGKTYYGDRPPKGGLNVTRIEVDPPASNVTLPVAPKDPMEDAKDAEKAPPDIATQRRERRNRLEANLIKAREKLAAAKGALADAAVPDEDERQFIQQRKPADSGGDTGSGMTAEGRPMGGMLGMAARRNCREVNGRDGQTVIVCPAFVPNERYMERVAKLEEAVGLAELEVAEAETAYRRGVD
jgi:Domain of unknown function (DUF4124)